MKRPKNFQELVAAFLWLQDLVLGIRLDRKQVQSRYNWSESTLDRRIRDGSFPRPIQFGGRPMWRLSDLAEAEVAGQLPCPVSA